MDDATRAELAELRRRAFGPEPSIADDPAAVDRLVELETLVLSEHAMPEPTARAVPDVGDAPADDGRAGGFGADRAGSGIAFHESRGPEDEGMPSSVAVATLQAASPQPDASDPQPGPRRAERGGIALVVALLAAGAVASTAVTPPPPSSVQVVDETARSAFTFARDANAEVLIRVPLDGWFGADVSPPAPNEIPDFPSSGAIEWASPLGDFYGWHLWIGGGTGALQNEQCILVMRGSTAKGRCVAAELRTQSALLVSVPYLAVDAAERPVGLVPGRRIGFWWFDDDAITVLLGAAPEER